MLRCCVCNQAHKNLYKNLDFNLSANMCYTAGFLSTTGGSRHQSVNFFSPNSNSYNPSYLGLIQHSCTSFTHAYKPLPHTHTHTHIDHFRVLFPCVWFLCLLLLNLCCLPWPALFTGLLILAACPDPLLIYLVCLCLLCIALSVIDDLSCFDYSS